MKIEIEMSAETLKEDIENLQAFKNRWIEILCGFSEIDEVNDNLKTCALLEAERFLLHLHEKMEEAETEKAPKAHNN